MDLENVSVGDEVIVVSAYHQSIAVVGRVTPTQIITSNGVKYSRKTGRLISTSKWDTCYIEHATPERIAAIRAAKIAKEKRHRLQGINWLAGGAITDEMVDRVLAIISEREAKE